MKYGINDEKEVVKIQLQGYMIVMAMFILFAPFIYPILTMFLIKLEIFESVNQLEQIIKLFSNFYMIFICIIIILILVFEFGNGKILRDIISKIKVRYQKGDSSVEFTSTLEDKKEKFDDSEEFNEESKTIKKELQEKFKFSNEKTNIKFETDEKKILLNKNTELEMDIRNMRFFSAYNILDVHTKQILKNIKETGKIEKEVFKRKLLKYYKSKYYKKNKSKVYAQNITEEVIFDLIYLDIIEYSEDDKYILLTKNGIQFVEKYLKGDGDYGKFN